MPPWRP
ncbi:putative K+-transporting ATPase, F subunit [Bordetella pertussis B200]|nr:putative K+-transporting ATPase, F subunit [Bordetella pertussis B200]